jgi:hypothetical protein
MKGGSHMAVMDEFREERESIKHGTFKQKRQYFNDYYKWPLIVTVLALLFVGALVYQFATKKDTAFFAVMLNGSSYSDNEWFMEDYTAYAGIDTGKYKTTVDTGAFFTVNSMDETTYYTSEKLDTYAGIGELDVMVGGGEEFAHFANSTLFIDLREIMTQEQLKRYEPYFYYIDGAVIDSALETGEDIDLTSLCDPKTPEEMEDPVPIAVYVESSEKLNEAYYFKNAENGVAVGIYANSSNSANALAFIDYLMTAQE